MPKTIIHSTAILKQFSMPLGPKARVQGAMTLLSALLFMSTLPFLTACAPTTRYRRGALVPMPTGDSLTQPQEGVLDVSGSVSHQDVPVDHFPREGDAALQATHTTLSANARFRLGPYLRLGAQGFFANAGMASATATGTPPMDGQSVYGLGPSLSFNYRRSRWAVGAGASVTIASVPWTTWRRADGGSNATFELSERFGTEYRPYQAGREVMPLVTLALGATYIPASYLEVFGGLSIQNSLRNVGFDNVQRDGSTLSAREFGVVPFAGVTARIPAGAYLRAQYFLPLGYSQFTGAQQNLGGFMATLGWDISRREQSESLDRH